MNVSPREKGDGNANDASRTDCSEVGDHSKFIDRQDSQIFRKIDPKSKPLIHGNIERILSSGLDEQNGLGFPGGFFATHFMKLLWIFLGVAVVCVVIPVAANSGLIDPKDNSRIDQKEGRIAADDYDLLDSPNYDFPGWLTTLRDDILECAPGQHEQPDANGNLECVDNECPCPNGVGTSGEDCAVHGETICLSCNQYYHFEQVYTKPVADTLESDDLYNYYDYAEGQEDISTVDDDSDSNSPSFDTTDSDKVAIKEAEKNEERFTCEPNECFCPNGKPSKADWSDHVTCEEHEMTRGCDFCNPGFHRHETAEKCELNRCGCGKICTKCCDGEDHYAFSESGVAFNTSCPVNGQFRCCECRRGFILKDNLLCYRKRN